MAASATVCTHVAPVNIPCHAWIYNYTTVPMYYYNYKNREKSERIFEQAKSFLCVFQLGLHAFHRIILLRPLITTLLTPLLLSHFIFAPDKSLVILWKMRFSDKVRKNSP